MKLVLDTQVRLTDLKTSLNKDIFKDKLSPDNYIELSETIIVVWDYKGKLKNEKVFDSYMIIDNITILFDSETQYYEAYRDGVKFDHIIFKDLARWIKIRVDKDKSRLLSRMKRFRSELLNKKLDYRYYMGIYSDKFTVVLKGKDYFFSSWDLKNDINLISVDENFSFFIKICKLIL